MTASSALQKTKLTTNAQHKGAAAGEGKKHVQVGGGADVALVRREPGRDARGRDARGRDPVPGPLHALGPPKCRKKWLIYTVCFGIRSVLGGTLEVKVGLRMNVV